MYDMMSAAVPYKIKYFDGEEVSIQSAAQFPSGRKITSVWEPTVDATIITPTEFVGGLMALCQDRRGDLVDHTVLSPTKTMMRCSSSPHIACTSFLPRYCFSGFCLVKTSRGLVLPCSNRLKLAHERSEITICITVRDAALGDDRHLGILLKILQVIDPSAARASPGWWAALSSSKSRQQMLMHRPHLAIMTYLD